MSTGPKLRLVAATRRSSPWRRARRWGNAGAAAHSQTSGRHPLHSIPNIMELLQSPAAVGMLTILGLAFLAVLLACGAWFLAFMTRLIARYAFSLQLRGRLWCLYLLAALPLGLIMGLLDQVGWPMAGLLVGFFGAAPLIRNYVKAAPRQAQEGAAWSPMSWVQALGLSAGSVLAGAVLWDVAAAAIQIAWMSAVASILVGVMQ